MWTKGFNDSPAQKNVEGGLFLRGRTQWRAGGITWTVFLVFYDRHPTGGHRLCSLVVPVCSTMPSRRPRKTEEARDFERPRKKKSLEHFPSISNRLSVYLPFFFVLPALRVTSAPCGPGGPCCGTVPTRVQCVLSLSLSLSLCLSFFFFRFASEIFISGQPAEHLDQWPVNNWRVVRSVALDGGPRPRRRRRPRPRSMP